jgi:hypothetical protein
MTETEAIRISEQHLKKTNNNVLILKYAKLVKDRHKTEQWMVGFDYKTADGLRGDECVFVDNATGVPESVPLFCIAAQPETVKQDDDSQRRYDEHRKRIMRNRMRSFYRVLIVMLLSGIVGGSIGCLSSAFFSLSRAYVIMLSIVASLLTLTAIVIWEERKSRG